MSNLRDSTFRGNIIPAAVLADIESRPKPEVRLHLQLWSETTPSRVFQPTEAGLVRVLKDLRGNKNLLDIQLGLFQRGVFESPVKQWIKVLLTSAPNLRRLSLYMPSVSSATELGPREDYLGLGIKSHKPLRPLESLQILEYQWAYRLREDFIYQAAVGISQFRKQSLFLGRQVSLPVALAPHLASLRSVVLKLNGLPASLQDVSSMVSEFFSLLPPTVKLDEITISTLPLNLLDLQTHKTSLTALHITLERPSESALEEISPAFLRLWALGVVCSNVPDKTGWEIFRTVSSKFSSPRHIKIAFPDLGTMCSPRRPALTAQKTVEICKKLFSPNTGLNRVDLVTAHRGWPDSSFGGLIERSPQVLLQEKWERRNQIWFIAERPLEVGSSVVRFRVHCKYLDKVWNDRLERVVQGKESIQCWKANGDDNIPHMFWVSLEGPEVIDE
ncbi:hypothetical protein QBC44DRAFT_403153 [Cladorrhinum sp. PSN332]|nr:hypothetical protein QBC44DRAFT_403153 [Cladorrhinum sp. PSN332]